MKERTQPLKMIRRNIDGRDGSNGKDASPRVE